jgi:hypothetical protein
MSGLAEYVDGQLNLTGAEQQVSGALAAAPERQYLPHGGEPFGTTKSAFAIALHQHQPLTPSGGDDLRTAGLISNLQYMFEHQDIGDNHNAESFAWCYKRIAEYCHNLLSDGKQPRVMLEYSGTLLHGLRHMGRHDVLDALKSITCDPGRWHTVEWLGMPWGHAVAPSTPVQDYRIHVRAFQQHFAAIFGWEPLQRIRGFSPSEMALPNHPDVAYEFVKTLRECGYQWVLVQEHTVEEVAGGHNPRTPHYPYRLVCKNSKGETAEITAIVKTQGSDTKLIGQMQPYYEALSLGRQTFCGKQLPPLVTQISDGENGGVMINEFPDKFHEVTHLSSWSETPAMTVSEYLEHIEAAGIKPSQFPALQPIFQGKIWSRVKPGCGPEKLQKAIDTLKKEDSRFHLDGGSWTNNISWVRGYEDVLGPMERASALFHEKVLAPGLSLDDSRVRNAVFHLLCSQTSCYRYWGQGLWTEYGKEICRRTEEILRHDF